MAVIVNLRHLEDHSLRLQGEASVAELDIESRDEVVRTPKPLSYDLEVQALEGGLFIQGTLRLPLTCECVRCLKVYDSALELDGWQCHVPLEGEESAPVVNDCVDLTPYLREDILLEFPQHPLCDPECRGLPKKWLGEGGKGNGAGRSESGSSAWAELNKLKL